MHPAYRLGALRALAHFTVGLAFSFVIAPSAHAFDDTNWTASGGDQNWSNSTNWSLGLPPTAGDRVLFTDAGAVSTIGVTTSVLDADWEIGELTIDNSAGLSHTIDLGQQHLYVRDLLEQQDRFYDQVATTTTIKNGSLKLGTSERTARLSIAAGVIADNVVVDLSEANFDANIESLAVGHGSLDPTSYNFGKLIGGSSGAIVIGTLNQPGEIIVGKSTGYTMGDGDVDLGSQDSFSAIITELSVGVGQSSGYANGRLTLPSGSNIQAEAIRVGHASDRSSADGTLRVGGQSKIVTSNLEIGTGGIGQFMVAGELTLGTATERVDLAVGTTDNSSAGISIGVFQIDGALNAHFGSISAGVEPAGNFYSTSARIIAGIGGDVTVGSPDGTGNILVGRNSRNATLSLAELHSFSATVQNFWIGTSERDDNVSAQVGLPVSTTIHAESIRIGYQTSGFESSVELNGHSELHADELLVGWDAYDAVLNAANIIRGEQHLTIGDSARPTRIVVGHASDSSWLPVHAKFWASLGGSLDADLSSLIVGEAAGSSAQVFATFQGAQHGEIRIGTPEQRGTLAVGVATGSAKAQATLDLGDQDKLQANLDRFDIGISDQYAEDVYVRLPETVVMDALNIEVGRTSQPSFHGSVSLTLGTHNQIETDNIKIGMGPISVWVDAPLNSDLLLGSVQRPVDLTIGVNHAPRDFFQYKYGSTLDLSTTVTTAFFDEVVIGNRTLVDNTPITGHLNFGPQSQIDANRIVLAQGNSVGILDFQGGRLTVGELSRGTGTAEFNWTGGRLEVGQFGTPAIPFNLSHFAAATLSVPDSLAATHIFGNYINGGLSTIETGLHLGELQQIVISGTASLKGALAIQLEPGFDPVVGEQFTILSAASVSGKFTSVTGFFAGDTFLNPVYHPTFVELQAYRAGDGNLDGLVDGADYTPWSDHFLKTTQRGVLDGDYNGDGLVDGVDYVIWADHFTATLSTVATSSVATSTSISALSVPEPSAQALAGIGILLMAAYRGRRWIY